jgi:hypothetical protein
VLTAVSSYQHLIDLLIFKKILPHFPYLAKRKMQGVRAGILVTKISCFTHAFGVIPFG